MPKQCKPGKALTDRLWIGAAWVGIGFGAALLTGCNTPAKTHSGDPLFGEFYPKGPGGQPLPPAGQPSAQGKTPVLGVPVANSASSNAAIANNTNLPGARPLAINENAPNWTLTNTSNTNPAQNGNAPKGNGPTVQPLPRDNTSAPGQVTALEQGGIQRTGSWSAGATSAAPGEPTVRPVSAADDASVDELRRTLQAKGAVGLTQEPAPDGVTVSCFVPHPSNPNHLRFFETTAADQATALRALVQQIDR